MPWQEIGRTQKERLETKLEEAADASATSLRWLQETAEPSKTATATLGALAVLLGISRSESPTWAELRSNIGQDLQGKMSSLQLSKEAVKSEGKREYMEKTKLAAKIFARSSSSQAWALAETCGLIHEWVSVVIDVQRLLCDDTH
eukprot:756211-Hanusia_phi.AAC.12